MYLWQMQNTMTLIRQKVGHGNVRKWVEDEFGIPYRSFVYQVRQETMRYRDVVKLLRLLDIEFTDLKQATFDDILEKKRQEEKAEREEKREEKKAAEPQKLSALLGVN